MPAATAAVPRIADFFTPCLRRAIGYGEQLVKDIPPDKFGHMPHPNMNHPAFCIGHLSLYPNRVLTILGRTDLHVEKPGYPELFQAGTLCVEQDGRYPGKDELVSYYLDGYRRVCELLPNLGDDVFRRDNPLEGRLRELFPSVGTAVNFLLNNHHATHLGQISAWRRAMGMGSVM